MISRGKKLIALLISTAVIASFPSCSSEVGQIEFHKDSSPHAASEENGDTAAADVTTEQTTTTTTTTEPVYRGNIYDTNYNLITY